MGGSFEPEYAGFDSFNGRLHRMKGFKSHHRIRDFHDETLILFHPVIQIVNPEYFNKTGQTGKHRQNINILEACMVCTIFIHNSTLSDYMITLFQDRHSGRDSRQAILPDALRANANLFH
jgi:hypothetical protein